MHTLTGRVHTQRGALKATEALHALRPDLILLVTPHGIALSNDFAVFTASNSSGFALVGGDLHNSSIPPFVVGPLALNADADAAAALVASLRDASDNVTAMLPWAGL
jgi:hypothetical protein